MNLTHRNRFSQFTLCLGEFRSAAVPPLQRRGLMQRIRLVNYVKKAAKKSPLRCERIPASRFDRSVEFRGD